MKNGSLNDRDTVILSAARTPVGNFGGAYREYDALQLGTTAAKAAIERAGIGVEHIDEVIIGSGGQPIEFANIARQISLEVGIPIGTPGVQRAAQLRERRAIDRQRGASHRLRRRRRLSRRRH